MKTTLALACILGLAPTVAAAGTLTTPPFPGIVIGTGSIVCTATNVGTSDAVVTYEIFNDYGDVLSTLPDFVLPPGRTYPGAVASLSNTSASFCRFTVQGKVRASLSHVVNGSVAMVVPAGK
jgi:hypothetical protein